MNYKLLNFKTIFFLIIFFVLFGRAKQTFAATINSSGCTAAAINSAIGSASSGDTVLINGGVACTSTWSGSDQVIINKQITLEGATTCTGRASSLSCIDHTVITGTTGYNGIIINSSNVVITGITINGTFSGSIPSAGALGLIQVSEDTNNVRVHHNHIGPCNDNSNQRGTYVYNASGGFSTLLDHNYFNQCDEGVGIDGATSQDSSYWGSAQAVGSYSWATPLNLASSQSEVLYIEDNKFVNSFYRDGFWDSYNGARFVVRYNDVINTGGGSHGMDSGGFNRSTLIYESYRNTYNDNSGIWMWGGIRGGSYMIFDEIITGSYGGFMDLRSYRSTEDYGTGICDGTTAMDQNSSGAQGYACRDQVGRGPETNPNNDWPIKTNDITFSESLMPAYSWNNLFKGSAPTVANNFNVAASANTPPDRASQYHILNNRDFYNEVSNFNGTSGVGSGTLTNRPATCMAGVAYWATDQGNWNQSGSGGQGILYKCTATNTWTLYYTPYIYPHPLQGGTPPSDTTAPSAPSGLSVQ